MGIEQALILPDEPTPHQDLDPTDPDSDGDGWWDGRFGVYGAGYNSENVILYMEHLWGGGRGLQNHQTVPEQAGYHKVRKTSWSPERENLVPSAGGADLFGDDWVYHSNLHIGELQWKTLPTDKGSLPSPELTVEVDFYEEANTSMNTPSWERGIERNFAFYGIDLDIIRDEVISKEDMENLWLGDPDNGFGISEIDDIGWTFGDRATDEYVVVLTYADSIHPELGRSQSGFNNPFTKSIAIFAEGHLDSANDVERYNQPALQQSPYQTGMEMTTAKTLIHEFGHSFALGEVDDDLIEHPARLGEVYSGSSDDDTPETVSSREEWSIMSAGWGTRLLISPMNGTYFAFSIEEVSTIEQ